MDYILRDEQGRVEYHFVLLYLLARHLNGVVKAGSDAEKAKWVPFEKITELETHPHLTALLKRLV